MLGQGGLALIAMLISVSACAGESAPGADPAACGARLIGSAAVAASDNVPTVALSANHHPITLIIDTGAELTMLTPEAAARIDARPPTIEINHSMRGIGGAVATREVELDSLSAGPVPLQWRRLLVAPITIARGPTGALDGLLGADELSDYDIDLDLPEHRIGFYAKQTCANAAPAWSGRYSTIAAARSPSDHLFFPVTIDGRRVSAIIDTGAQRTTLATATAHALGVTDAALAADHAVTSRGAAGERLGSHVHRFACLDVAGDVIREPVLVVTSLALQDADIVLGADFLATRRLWLSYGSQRIFLADRDRPAEAEPSGRGGC